MHLSEDPQLIQSFDEETKKFYYFHGVQLLGSKFPVHLIPQLKHKLYNKVYDAGQYFNIIENADKETFEVHAVKDLKKEQDVFIIDHAISFRYPELRSLLKKSPEAVQRLSNMTKYLGTRKDLPSGPAHGNEAYTELNQQFENMSLESVSQVEIPPNTVCLSLMSNNLTSQQQIIQTLKRLPSLKALWLNENPLEESEVLRQFIENETGIEIYNSRFTKNVNAWGLKFVTKRDIAWASDDSKNSSVYYLDVSGRDFFANVDPKIVLQRFPNLRRINIKDHEIVDLEHLNRLIALLKHPNLRRVDADLSVEQSIFLLYKNLQDGLKKEFQKLLVNGHNVFMDDPTEVDLAIDQIHQRLFKLTNCYRLANTEQLDQTSIWYVNDELGSSLTHSDQPEVVVCPFLFAKDNKMNDDVIAFSIMWAIKDLVQGQIVERDYLHGLTEARFRSSRLSVWYNVPREPFRAFFADYEQKINETSEKFKNNKDELLKLALQPNSTSAAPAKTQFKVLTDSPLVTEYLKHPSFKVTTNLEEADILWIDVGLSEELETIKKERGVIVNQFPYQACLVMKNNLAKTIQSTLGNTTFLQRTYDLETELPVFVGQYFQNEEQELDNLWISKPPNMARSMDMLVSDNLDIIIRNMETGPKLVQKYISNPVKRLNHKIDLRIIVIVKSMKPLEVYQYKHFWIRTSNNDYNLDCRFREEYETHFTVMNYGKKLTQVNYPEFIKQFDEDYSSRGVNWQKMNEKIKEMLRLTFLAAVVKHPEMHSESSRAMYGVDVMIDEDNFEPKLLEFTFSPDCNRACKFYPTFFNDVFETLFLGVKNENVEPLF